MIHFVKMVGNLADLRVALSQHNASMRTIRDSPHATNDAKIAAMRGTFSDGDISAILGAATLAEVQRARERETQVRIDHVQDSVQDVADRVADRIAGYHVHTPR